MHLGQSEPLWDMHTFQLIFGKAVVEEVNLLLLSRHQKVDPKKLTWRASMVYGFTKLGYYGCTWWLFTDGLSEAFPRNWNQSPLFLFVKAALEFLIIPHCLNTPRSQGRLLPFLVS